VQRLFNRYKIQHSILNPYGSPLSAIIIMSYQLLKWSVFGPLRTGLLELSCTCIACLDMKQIALFRCSLLSSVPDRAPATTNVAAY